MTNRKYKLRYLPVFEQDLVQTVSYITNVLKNPDAEGAWTRDSNAGVSASIGDDGRTIDVTDRIAEGDHHAGGDFGIISDFINMVSGGETSISCTKIQDSIYGHVCVFKADESMNDGTVKYIREVNMNEYN